MCDDFKDEHKVLPTFERSWKRTSALELKNVLPTLKRI